MTSDPLRNHTDDWFIEELDKHISNEPVSTLIQDYIKKLVQHEVDVITDSDWFAQKVNVPRSLVTSSIRQMYFLGQVVNHSLND